MKILSATVENFGSYRNLEFSFTDQGLTLISGPTGSGKSTLCDIIPWVLFGVTSKNGSADEVRNWSSDDVTKGEVTLHINGTESHVFRQRGARNDLFIDHDGVRIRGKDLNDTQKQINHLLNLSAETYLAGAYLHEFSQTSQFFTLNAKNRRVITEQLADLTLAKSLQEKLSIFSKELKKEKDVLVNKIAQDKKVLDSLNKTHNTCLDLNDEWEKSFECSIQKIEIEARDFNKLKDNEIKELQKKHDNFESEQLDRISTINSEIEYLQKDTFTDYNKWVSVLQIEINTLRDSKCNECGAPKNVDQVLVKTKELYDIQRKINDHDASVLHIDTLTARLSRIGSLVNPYLELIEKAKERKNTYREQLESMKTHINPYVMILESSKSTIETGNNSLSENISLEKDISVEQSDIELLLESIADFRSVCVENTVVFLERTTNDLLEAHFDAEIRCSLSAESADKIEVILRKDGNVCSFTQLSKGQRQILRLAFGVAIMKAISNFNGSSFNCLFFDEIFSGLDEEMKAKGFTLLETLALTHESVFVIDHSTELKSLFSNSYEVELVSGGSQIEKA